MNIKTISMCAMAMLMSIGANAQYPGNTPEEGARAHAIMKKAQEHSDSAWQVALPIVQEEHHKGRLYVNWASRPQDLNQAKIPSFPGAEGGGMYSFGGRGGKVITVTNLNDEGPGSFRWACEQGGARIVVFNVSGMIRLTYPLIIRAPYITIAGQTAPGDGVCITGESVWIDTHDVVIRHLRLRRGETFVGRRDDCLGGNPVGNIMLDHLSCSFGLDENISFYRHMYTNDAKQPQTLKLGTVNVTIQNTISAKGLDTYNHAFGSTLGGENAAFLRNLWASNNGRNPSIGWNGIFNFVNNVLFNWYGRTVDGGDYSACYNIYNNYYKPGPATPVAEPVGHRVIKPDGIKNRNGFRMIGRVYCDGNIVEGNARVTANNWDGGVQVGGDGISPADEAMVRHYEPFAHPFYNVMKADEAYEFVLNNVGASFPQRDELDKKIIEEVRTGVPFYAKDAQPDSYNFKYRRLPRDSWKQGIITDPQQVGGLPTYGKWKPYKDTDLDGMPDAWEKAHGLNPNDPSDANADCTGDGYTNIEKYINGIPTDKKVDWTDLRNNHDTLLGKKSL